MTEIATRTDATPTAPPDTATSHPLVVWALAAREAHQIAQSLARTSFVPSTLRGKAGDITAAILAGQELGLQPMSSLRSLDIIQGTPALRAHAMRGLVQSRGHQVELVESGPTRCVMRGRRLLSQVGGPTWGEWQQVEWTIDRATQLGLTTKDQWRKQPQTMLVARATGELCRLIASDALYAMPYAAEELTGEPAAAPARGGRVTMGELLTDADEPVSAPPDDVTVAEPEDWPATATPGGEA